MHRVIAILLVLLVLIPAVQVAAQDEEPETVTVTITEDDLNARLDEREGPLAWNVDLQEGVAELSTTIERNGNAFNVVIIIIGATGGEGQGGGLFNAVDIEITDADGNPLEIDPQRGITNGLDALERSVRQAVIAAMDAATPNLSLNSVVIGEGLVTLEFVMGDGSVRDFRERELPANVTENEDGTLTVAVTGQMINDALAAIVERRDTILSLTAQIDGLYVEFDGQDAGTMTFNIESSAENVSTQCNNELITGTVVFVVDHKSDDFADIVFSGTGEPLTCGDVTLNERQSQRIIAILIGFMNRYFQLQTRGGEVISYELAPGVIEVLVMPPARQGE